MNMEPLLPALPSTNECEDTVGDNGRTSERTQTHTRDSAKSHGVSLVEEKAHVHAPPADTTR